MFVKYISIAATFALFSSVGLAKELSLDEVRAIQSKMKATESLQVDFTQTSYVKLRDKSVKREGKAAFAKPDKFRWTLEAPTTQSKIFDGKDFLDYDKGSNSALRYSPTGPQAYDLRQIVDVVLNFDSLLKRYDLVKAEQDGDMVKIDLKPKTDQAVASVAIHVSTKDSFISFLKLTMKGGNSIAQEFRNPKRGAVPGDTFVLPKTVKISDSN